MQLKHRRTHLQNFIGPLESLALRVSSFDQISKKLLQTVRCIFIKE